MKRVTLIIFLISSFAFSQIDSLLYELQTIKNDTNKIRLLNKISRTSFNSDIKLAFKYLPEAIALSKELEFQDGLADSYKNLGTAFFYTREYDSTKVYWYKSLQNISSKDFKKKGDIYSNIGVLYQRLGLIDSSLNNYSKSVKYRIQLKDSSFVARSYNNIAALYRQKGDYKKALEFYFKAFPIYTAYGLKKEESDALNGIGLLYKDLEDYDKALQYLQEAHQLRKLIKNPRLIASSINNIATVYYETNNYAKAKDYYNDYLEFALKIKDKRALAGVYSNLGNINSSNGQINEAIENYSNANKLFLEIGDIDNIALTFINLGGLHYKEKNYKLANQYYIQAKENAKKSKSLPLLVNAYLGLTDSFHQLKKYDKSHQNFKLYISTKDSLFNRDLSEKVAFYQEQYEAEKKSKEIQILKTETVKKDKDIAVSKLFRNWAILFLILSIITLILLFNSYKMKKKGFKLTADLLKKEKLNSDLEVKLQKKELELKSVELSSLTMSSIQKNKILVDLDAKLTELKNTDISKSNLINELESMVKLVLDLDDNWATFQKHFDNVHPNFFKQLNAKFPKLTNNDLKACGYIRMNLSSKEVSILTNVAPKSVKMNRYRLKKKLNLDKNDDLKNFLFSL